MRIRPELVIPSASASWRRYTDDIGGYTAEWLVARLECSTEQLDWLASGKSGNLAAYLRQSESDGSEGVLVGHGVMEEDLTTAGKAWLDIRFRFEGSEGAILDGIVGAKDPVLRIVRPSKPWDYRLAIVHIDSEALSRALRR